MLVDVEEQPDGRRQLAVDLADVLRADDFPEERRDLHRDHGTDREEHDQRDGGIDHGGDRLALRLHRALERHDEARKRVPEPPVRLADPHRLAHQKRERLDAAGVAHRGRKVVAAPKPFLDNPQALLEPGVPLLLDAHLDDLEHLDAGHVQRPHDLAEHAELRRRDTEPDPQVEPPHAGPFEACAKSPVLREPDEEDLPPTALAFDPEIRFAEALHRGLLWLRIPRLAVDDTVFRHDYFSRTMTHRSSRTGRIAASRRRNTTALPARKSSTIR